MCVAYQWLTWLTSQDLVTSWKIFKQGVLSYMVFQWLTSLTSQNSLTSLRNFEYVCGISVVDLVDFTGFSPFMKKFSNWVCFHIWHFNGWLGCHTPIQKISMKSVNSVKSTKSTTDMPHTYLKILHEVVNSVKSTKSTTDMQHTYSNFLN